MTDQDRRIGKPPHTRPMREVSQPIRPDRSSVPIGDKAAPQPADVASARIGETVAAGVQTGASQPVRLVVAGRIAPKGSRTLGVRRDGSRYSRPASPHEHDWTEAVAVEARVARSQVGTLPPPYLVWLGFRFAAPARPSHTWPSRLDIDKAARAVLDGLVRGGLLEDDRHVVTLVAQKRWAAATGDECVHIVVSHEEPAA